MRRALLALVVLGSAVAAAPAATASPHAALERRAAIAFAVSSPAGRTTTAYLEAYQPLAGGAPRVVVRTAPGSHVSYDTPATFGDVLPAGAFTVTDKSAELRTRVLGQPLHVEWVADKPGLGTVFVTGVGVAAYKGVELPATATVEIGVATCYLHGWLSTSALSDPGAVVRPLAASPRTAARRCSGAAEG